MLNYQCVPQARIPDFIPCANVSLTPDPAGGQWWSRWGTVDRGKKRKPQPTQTSQQTRLPDLFFFSSGRRTSPRQKLLGITFPNCSKMPAHPFLLVAMVRDDGAPDGYNTRQRAGKGFSRGRRRGEWWEEGKALPGRGHTAHQHRLATADLPGEVSGCPQLWEGSAMGACAVRLFV